MLAYLCMRAVEALRAASSGRRLWLVKQVPHPKTRLGKVANLCASTGKVLKTHSIETRTCRVECGHNEEEVELDTGPAPWINLGTLSDGVEFFVSLAVSLRSDTQFSAEGVLLLVKIDRVDMVDIVDLLEFRHAGVRVGRSSSSSVTVVVFGQQVLCVEWICLFAVQFERRY